MSGEDPLVLIVHFEDTPPVQVGVVSRKFASDFISRWMGARYALTCPDASHKDLKYAEEWFSRTLLVVAGDEFTSGAVAMTHKVVGITTAAPHDDKGITETVVELNKTMTEAYKRMNRERNKEDEWRGDEEEEDGENPDDDV